MRRPIRLTPIVISFTILALAAGISAQEQGEKKPLTMEDYARWRSVTSTSISDDGKWVTFAYSTFQADDTLYVKSLETDKEYEVPRGTRPQFSDNSTWVAYLIAAPTDEGGGPGRQGGPERQVRPPRGERESEAAKAELMNLETGEKLTWENASSFGFPEGSSHFIVKKTRTDQDAEYDGTDMILRNLREGYEELIGSVSEYSFNKPGSILAYTVDAADRNGNGVYIIRLDTGARRPLDNGAADYSRLTWDEEGSALAVLKGTEVDTLEHLENVLMAFTGLTGRRTAEIVYDPAENPGFPNEMVISEGESLTWSEDLTKLFFGIRAQQDKEEEDGEAGGDEEEANVKVFHWADEGDPQGLEGQFEREKDMSFRSVLNLRQRKFIQLTDLELRTITVTRDGKWGIGQNDREYISDWKEQRADYYRVNVETGERTLFLEGHISGISARGFRGGGGSALSPDSKHFLFWQDGHIWDYALDSGRKTNLTENAPVSFADAEWDYVGTRPPYGVTGWSEGGNGVILTHRYDLWLQPLNGGPAANLTGGRGERDEIRFRYIQTDPEERFIDLTEPMLLSAYGQWTKKSGFFMLRNRQLSELVLEDCRFGNPRKAKEADAYLFTRETFADFPNYFVGSGGFSSPRQVTDANPWQPEYKWGHSILIDYTNNDGVRLQGALAVPDDHTPGQRLPMIVRFYEKMSQNLHSYPFPRYSHSPQFADYVGHGYMILQPDVHFRTGSSHTDMLECIEAAVRKVIELGYADPEHIGLNGHSYSGGGSCYIATRSEMFAAVVAGAAPIDLYAEFNVPIGGTLNNHSYDIHGQGRYGVSPYEDMEMYRVQSPITFVETMDTPLLYLHGEDDGTVQYLQGMEFYNALRFLGKPVIFCSYPGEGHGLRRLGNQKDFQKRIEEFFGHYLKGEPAAPWIVAKPDPEKN